MKMAILILSTILVLKPGCQKSGERSEYDGSKNLEEQYHIEALKMKGDSAYFIPKARISWYFRDSNFIDLTEIRKDDVILFFDTSGNIVYQSLVATVTDSGVQIINQDLKTADYYKTVLSIDSIRDLKKGYRYSIVPYRHR